MRCTNIGIPRQRRETSMMVMRSAISSSQMDDMNFPTPRGSRFRGGFYMRESSVDEVHRRGAASPVNRLYDAYGVGKAKAIEQPWVKVSRNNQQFLGAPTPIHMTAASPALMRTNSVRQPKQRVPASNLQMSAVSFEVKQTKDTKLDNTDKATKEFMDTFQDKVFEGIIDESTKVENQIKVEAILEKYNGDVAQSYKEISSMPELYDDMVQKLDEQIDNCYKFYIKEGKGIYEKLDRVFNAIGECLEKSEEFQEEYFKNPQEKGLKGYYLSKFGSSLNGTLTKNSDLDMTLISDDSSFNILQLTRAIRKALQENESEPGRYEFDEKEYNNALLFKDTKEDWEVDFVINRTANVINSDLILQYSKMDKRFSKLMYFFKDWLKVEKYLPDEQLNSFSIYNLLIAYMQKEQMFPNMQALASVSFENNGESNPFLDEIVKPARLQQQQIRAHGKLMYDNLNMYYDTFDELKVNFEKAGLIDSNASDSQSPFDIKNFQSDGPATLKTPAEILIGFFKHYGQKHTPEHGIDISQFDEQQKYTVDPEMDPKSLLLSLYYQGNPYPKRADMLKQVDKFYDQKIYVKHLDLPRDFMDNIQKQYQVTWNEIGPWQLSDEQIYERHYKLLYAEKNSFIKSNSENPYYIIDPFDHLYNPARCITMYSANDWPNNGKKDQEEGEDGDEKPAVLYPDVWTNALKCVLRSKMKQKFLKTVK